MSAVFTRGTAPRMEPPPGHVAGQAALKHAAAAARAAITAGEAAVRRAHGRHAHAEAQIYLEGPSAVAAANAAWAQVLHAEEKLRRAVGAMRHLGPRA